VVSVCICTRGIINEEKGNARIGAMESLVVSPTVEPRGSSEIGDEFFFLKLFLRYTLDSASRAVAAPIESVLFGVNTRVERRGFYFGDVSYPTL
jgi:hypothetical protein